MSLRRYWLAAGLVVVSLSGFAQTQTDLNTTAYDRYKEADQALNQTYQTILKQYSRDPLFVRNLKKAQRLWLQLRDADLRAKYPTYGPGHYGSVQPMCESAELTALTVARTRQLRVWLTGVPEGEMCTGSVRVVAGQK